MNRTIAAGAVPLPAALQPKARVPTAVQGAALSAAVVRSLLLALQHMGAAYGTGTCWEARIGAALSAVLDLFDERPDVARLCVVQSEWADPVALELRAGALDTLARRIDDGRHGAPRQPPPHTAHAVLAGAIGAIRARLIQPGPETVSDLLDPLMSLALLPYRGAAAALGRAVPLR